MITGPYHDFTLAGSKAIVFVLREYADMLDRGHAELEISFYNVSRVSYLLDDNLVIAACVWVYDPPKLMGWTYFTGVAEKHRGQGLYSRLSEGVEIEMKKLGATTSCSSMWVDNKTAIAAAEKHGKKVFAARTRKIIA